ncbi:MAG: nucleoside kinase, partial [Clostridium perfringens]|nr:nucleoside kinase [Clostridium perfringens]
MKSFRVNVNGESLLFNEGEKYSAILKKDYINEKIPITLVKQRNKYYEFTDLINKNIIIEKIKMPKKEAIDIFKSYKMQDKV